MMLPHRRRVLAALGATFLAGFNVLSAEEAGFPVTPLVPTAFKPQISISGDFETLQKMAVSMASLQEFRGIYRASGYEDLPDAQIRFPDLFITLPDRSIVAKSKIRGYYQALFCSWLGDDRATEFLKQLQLSGHGWIACGASATRQGEQVGAVQPATQSRQAKE